MWASRSALSVSLCVMVGCAQETQDATQAETPQTTAAAEPNETVTMIDLPEPLEIAPIAYFDNHCASCHGGNGSLYARPFVTPNDELPAVIEEMCAGPGMAPLEGRPLEALIEYHEAIRHDAPFVTFIERDATGLVFETTPGAEIIVSGGEVFKIGLDTWRVEPEGKFTLRVRQDGKSYRLPGWPEYAWSIGRPVTAYISDF